jgi:hypothetical protein
MCPELQIILFTYKDHDEATKCLFIRHTKEQPVASRALEFKQGLPAP